MPARTTAARKTRVCFVTGTRAEFGLMQSTLDAIRQHPKLDLQIVATGMHLDPTHNEGARSVIDDVHAVVDWPGNSGKDPATTAANTGSAIAALAQLFRASGADVVLVVGDRVEAFAAAAAAQISQICLAHIHGGDRALGQIDDSLRHAITKLAHIHFPATADSARRIAALGEDRWRIHRVGAPGIDGIVAEASPGDSHGIAPRRFALLILHPVSPDTMAEQKRARSLLVAVRSIPFEQTVIIHPNNDPGAAGIVKAWQAARSLPRVVVHQNLDRPRFLAMLRDAAVLVGNSSSGIIEAASFGTPVLDIGPRQRGRERSANVIHCEHVPAHIRGHLKAIWNNGEPRRSRARNVYGGQGAGERIAQILATLPDRRKLLRKLITY